MIKVPSVIYRSLSYTAIVILAFENNFPGKLGDNGFALSEQGAMHSKSGLRTVWPIMSNKSIATSDELGDPKFRR